MNKEHVSLACKTPIEYLMTQRLILNNLTFILKIMKRFSPYIIITSEGMLFVVYSQLQNHPQNSTLLQL